MTHEQLLQNVESTYKAGLELIKIKNKDYAAEGDAFKNFKSAEIAGVDFRRAILVRVLDKISRISNLLNKVNEVKDEKITDTLVDCINYLAILKASIFEDERSSNCDLIKTSNNSSELSNMPHLYIGNTPYFWDYKEKCYKKVETTGQNNENSVLDSLNNLKANQSGDSFAAKYSKDYVWDEANKTYRLKK